MSDTEFLSLYLREMGVQTPVSLVLSAHHITAPTEMEATAESLVEGYEVASLEHIAEEAMRCQRCALAEYRQQVVFGSGAPDAEVFFVGEPPNAMEEQAGQSLIGDDGALFEQMLQAMGLKRHQVYLAHLVKCATRHHQDPSPEMVHACQVWLHRQLRCIQPKVLVLLGRMASQALLQSDAPLRELRGTWYTYEGVATRVLYHPGYLLRSPRQKSEAWHDLQAIQQKLKGS